MCGKTEHDAEKPRIHGGMGRRKGWRGMKRERRDRIICFCMIFTGAVLSGGFLYTVWIYVPRDDIRYLLAGLYGGLCVLGLLGNFRQRRQICRFADELCGTLDDLTAGQKPEGDFFYEDTLSSKVQGKLLQFYDLMSEERRLSRQEKQVIQELVSDISHQVKTPIANLQMFSGILRSHDLSEEKRAEFLEMEAGQVDKLDFLLQSLIKMSRLETGTFTMHMERADLYDTIAQALSGIWAKAEAKNLDLAVECGSGITARHDPKWTAEALFNILDNAVKYTPAGGGIRISVRPWQFYTRVDIKDTGGGIPEEHCHEIFKRFWRGEEAASKEGVGLGLYLAQEIITKQRGYISVRSEVGSGSTFSVYLLT